MHPYDEVLCEEARVLSTLDFRNPNTDEAAVQQAIYDYLDVTGRRARPLRWVPDMRSARSLHLFDLHPAYLPLGSAPKWSAMIAAWQAGAIVRLDTSWLPLRSEVGELFTHYFHRMLGGTVKGESLPAHLRRLPENLRSGVPLEWEWLNAVATAAAPMLKAFAAGLFYIKIEDDDAFCIPRPSLWMDRGRIHREDGPALIWPSGECRYLWKGVHVPRFVIERPHKITTVQIRMELNSEIRRCMIERFGVERFVREAGTKPVSEDATGQLWQFQARDDAGFDRLHLFVEVENGTLEPDYTRRRYFLEVPPWMTTPREAVAWTYGLRSHEYEIEVRT